MPADNSHLIVAAARRRATATRRRAVAALRRMDATGTTITFETVAHEAGVSRSWLYNQPDIRAEIERLRARHPSPQQGPFPTGNGPPTPPCCGAWRRRPSATNNWKPRTGSCVRRLPSRSETDAPPTSPAAPATRRRRNLPSSSGPADRSVEDTVHHTSPQVSRPQVAPAQDNGR